MNNKRYRLESATLFADSLIWQLNRDYYQNKGLDAWREGTVPHNLTSNAFVGKTYAELIFAFLEDLVHQGNQQDRVYLLELGAGHGRLAFHILKQLDFLIQHSSLPLPPFCYILSDIVEENLLFFEQHHQFQTYFERGWLDVAYFDGVESKELNLRYSGVQIQASDLKQPLLAIANYFFDSLPNELFYLKNKTVSSCLIELDTDRDPEQLDTANSLKHVQATYHYEMVNFPYYQNSVFNELLEDYRDQLFDTHLFFPKKGLECLRNLRRLSEKGLLLLSMDKGFHELHDLENEAAPDIITHGSFSIWVNYHALQQYCEHQGGKALFPSFSTFHLELGCLFFVPDSEVYTGTQLAYHRFVDEYGPDDFNSLKRYTYRNMSSMNLSELIGILRLGRYDSILFKNILPHFKQLARQITLKERHRLAQSLHQTWEMYFTLQEPFDLAYEIGGVFYDLGFYQEALVYFQHSIRLFDYQADVYYNLILCYYQLREDTLFVQTLEKAQTAFPDYPKFTYLKTLDLNAT